MRHLLVSLVCAAPLAGCILETEFCGRGFVETEAGRCVPEEAPPPYYGDAGFDLGADVEIVEPEPFDPEPFEPEPPGPEPFEPEPPGPEPAVDPWEGRETLLIVDRSDRSSARETPSSPGYDLDAILVVDEFGEYIGGPAFWESAQINDPFGRNLSQDPEGALGEPDANGLRDAGRFVSLGAEGGFVHFGLELFEPIRSGASLVVFEMSADGDDERAEIYLCFAGQLDLSLCRSAGIIRGTEELYLP